MNGCFCGIVKIKDAFMVSVYLKLNKRSDQVIYLFLEAEYDLM